MAKKEFFTFKEALKGIKENAVISLQYLSYLVMCDLILIVFFIASINTHYLSQVFSLKNIFYAKYLLRPLVADFDGLRVMLFIVFIIFSMFMYLINKNCLSIYLESYRHESNIILKLKVDRKFIKRPILYTGLIINLISVASSVLIVTFIYKYLTEIVIIEGYSLLPYTCFDISLFSFLFLLSSGLVIISGYGTFKKMGL